MTTKRTARERGKKFEKRIAEKIHQACLTHNEEYKKLYETLENSELKPQRDSSSGTFARSTGDISLGLAQKFFPLCCECKDWKSLDLSIDSIFKEKIKSLTGIWNKQIIPAMNKARLSQGLLVFKAQRTLDYCFMPFDQYLAHIPFHNFTDKIDSILIVNQKWVILKFDEFIKAYLNGT